MMRQITITMVILLLMTIIISCNHAPMVIKSPDEKLSFSLQLNNGDLFYTLKKEEKLLLKKSVLGLNLVGDSSFFSQLEITDIQKSTSNKTWKTIWGKNKIIKNHYNQLYIYLKNKQHKKLHFQVRVFNDGIGFRYIVPQQKEVDSLLISNEKTTFNIATDGKAWTIPANFDSYEMLYRTTQISEVENANTPATFQLDNGEYLCIHEANLTDYAGMTLQNAGGTKFTTNLVPFPDGVKVKLNKTLVSPWRTLIITDNAAGIASSNIIQNLNEPCKLSNTTWINPMKYVGIWWGMHLGVNTWTVGEKHGATTENMKKYIDFAAANNIKGVLAEGWNTGWDKWGKSKAFDQTTAASDYDLKEIVRYAKQKNRAIIAHHETGGDFEYYEERMDTAFKMLHNLGIHALKTGYAGGTKGYYHHSQKMVQHYRKVVELAAKYELMLDVHEPIKATGISRTYPNMMTREGVRGMEWNAWSEGNPPEHQVILPFTRCVGGAIDYTPGVFDILYKNRKTYTKWNSNDKGNSRVNTTLAKQLALWVCLYSPLQMASDIIDYYEQQEAFDFFRQLNVDFEESHIIAAEIGDYFAVARKKGDKWYLGAITDENARTLQVNLSFLDTGKKYKAKIFADNNTTKLTDNPTALSIYEKEVNTTSKLEIEMLAGGGQAIIITELK